MNKTLSIFYNIFIALFLLSTLCICNVLSMHHDEDDIIQNNTHSPIESTPLIPLSEDLTFLEGLENTEIKGYFYIFIQKYLVQHDEIPETQKRRVLRLIAKFGGSTIGILAGVPYFELGKKAGGGNGPIAWGMGIATTIAVSGVGSWSYSNLLKNLDPQSIEEQNLVQKSKWVVPAHIVSHGLGLAGAVPTAYVAARFNTYKWLGAISYGLEYSLKTNGFLIFFEQVLSQKNQVDQPLLEEDQMEENSLLISPQLLRQHLSKKTIPSLLIMEDEEIEELTTSLEGNLTVEGYLNHLLNIPSQDIFLEETPDTWKKGYPKKAFIGGLCISSLLNVVHNFHCAYAAWSMIYDQQGFVIPMAALSVIPTFILESRAAIKVGGSLYDSAFYSAVGKPSPSLAQSLYPNLMKALPIICASLAGVTSYVGRYTVVELLEGFFPYKYALFFSIGGVLGPFLFTSNANYSLFQDLILAYTRSFGEESKKKLCSLVQDIEKLASVLNVIKKEEMTKFLENPNIQNSLSALNRVDSRETIRQIQEDNPIEVSPIEEPRRKNKSIWCGIL